MGRHRLVEPARIGLERARVRLEVVVAEHGQEDITALDAREELIPPCLAAGKLFVEEGVIVHVPKV